MHFLFFPLKAWQKFFIEGVVPQTKTSFVVWGFNQSSLLMSYNTEALAQLIAKFEHLLDSH